MRKEKGSYSIDEMRCKQGRGRHGIQEGQWEHEKKGQDRGRQRRCMEGSIRHEKRTWQVADLRREQGNV
jgi:hypothetical protein